MLNTLNDSTLAKGKVEQAIKFLLINSTEIIPFFFFRNVSNLNLNE